MLFNYSTQSKGGGLDLKDFTSKTISTIQFTVVERFIKNFEQQKIEIEQLLTMTQTSIYSNSHHFQLQNVFDMSYKPFSNGHGILYLHTNEGVFPFLISTNPAQFIQSYQLLASHDK